MRALSELPVMDSKTKIGRAEGGTEDDESG